MSENVKKPLLAACRQLLHPLVRILLRHGVPYGEFSDAVRGAYIDIAGAELIPPGRPHSDSRLSILTGIGKDEVHRIRTLDEGNEAEVGANRIARVLQGWSQDPAYLRPYGLPLEIPVLGDRISFEQLVKTYAGDANPRLLLDELLRAKAALETDDGYVRLLNLPICRRRSTQLGWKALATPSAISSIPSTSTFKKRNKAKGALSATR